MRVRSADSVPHILLGWGGRTVALEEAGLRNGHSLLTGSAAIDAKDVLEQQVESAMVVGELIGEPITEEEARARLAGMAASGSIEIELEVDDTGMVWKRTETFELLLTGVESGDERRSGQTITTRIAYAEWNAD